MKKIFAFTMFLALTGLTASAQHKREMKADKQRMHQKHRNADHIKDLNLTEAQKQQLKADRDNYKAQMETLRKNENITVKEMKARRKVIHDEQKAKMQALLTPEQKAKIASERASMESSRKNMDANRSNLMKEKLGLSNEQATKLKAQNEITRSKIKSIHENQSLSAEQKKEQMKAVKEASNAQRKAILTAEQLQKMNEFKKAGKGKHGKRTKSVQTTR